MEKQTAILVRRIRYSETSLIYLWLTKNHGVMKTMARGALRPKSPFRSLDLFFTCEIEIIVSRKSEIHGLRDAVTQNARLELRRDYRVTQVASYFMNLIDYCVEPGVEISEIFDLAERALDWLTRELPSQRGVLHFESSLARALGVGREEGPAWQILMEQCGESKINERRELFHSLRVLSEPKSDSSGPHS